MLLGGLKTPMGIYVVGKIEPPMHMIQYKTPKIFKKKTILSVPCMESMLKYILLHQAKMIKVTCHSKNEQQQSFLSTAISHGT